MEESVKENGSAAEIEESSASSEVNDKAETSDRNFRRVLAERKKDRAMIADLKAQLDSQTTSLLQAEGKKDELVSTYKARSEQREKELNEVKGNYAWMTVKSEVERALLKEGCHKPGNVIKLEASGVASLADHMNENFEVDADVLKDLVEAAKKEHPEYFQKARVPINDATPSDKINTTQTVNLKEIVGNEDARREYLAKLLDN